VPEVRQQSAPTTVEYVRFPDLEEILTIPQSVLGRADQIIE